MEKEQILELAYKLATPPKNFEISHCETVSHDNVSIAWLRFIQKGQKDYLGCEHYSMTIDIETKRLKGLMWLNKELNVDKYITEDMAREVAIKFLKENAPDLCETVEIKWIRPIRKYPENPPHDEGFKLKDGTTIIGMRVKMWANDTQKYSWVIVNGLGNVISFERDIIWDSEKHCRTTERWLHDQWLKEKEQGIMSWG